MFSTAVNKMSPEQIMSDPLSKCQTVNLIHDFKSGSIQALFLCTGIKLTALACTCGVSCSSLMAKMQT